jgi:hypothetical protein
MLRLAENSFGWRFTMLFRSFQVPRAATLALMGLMSLGVHSVGCGGADDPMSKGGALGAAGPSDAGGMPGLRESCAGPEQAEVACQPGLKCIAETRYPLFASCDYPIEVPPGGCCRQHVDCMADEICSNGACVPNTSGRCSSSLLTNASCAQGYVCVPGSAGEIEHCAEDLHPIPIGQACTGPGQCGKDGFCGGSACKPRKGEGEFCLRTPERQCKTGLSCDDEQVNGATVSVCRPSVCSPIGSDI